MNNAQDDHCDGTNGGSVAVLPEIVADKKSSKERESVDSVQVIFPNLDSVINLTRDQIAALKLPKVAFVADQDVVLAPVTETAVSNPILVKQRPSEATVEYALSLLTSPVPVTGNGVVTIPDDDSDDEETEVTVKIGTLGTFTRKSLELFQNMCKLSQDAREINEEQKWLARTSSFKHNASIANPFT